MQNETLAFVKYVLDKNGVQSEYHLEQLCTHADFLKESSRFIKGNKQVQNYDPIFAHFQKPIIKE
ncbi:hypothetical protein ELQ35_01800 [Peribacillus cavernae]|uniref:Uncharacterized protein n=1 Tax=Peribacillus cavernae TaxID=1674310 RepID=A0A3S1BCG7_9BACI|nr:hypothetical protein [Peribacillus cavernae]MDQ0221117.1 hypothetical protein [Peribacillus cavernae]RUQ32842.1 hypothetical protein ELQ35_01800 [Peribacillus cavernae]